MLTPVNFPTFAMADLRYDQCRMKVGAINAAAYAHSRNSPTATDEKRKIFFILVVISLVGTVSEKIIKIVATRCHILKLKCIKFDFGWGCAPDPSGGAYTALPRAIAGFKAT